MISGRNLLSYLLNDPFGESCLVVGGYLANTSGNAELSYPLLITGVYHTTRMAINRRRLINHINKYGLTSRIIEKFSDISWCSNQVAMAHTFGMRRYSEFENIFRRHNAGHYFKKEIKDTIRSIKSLFKR